MANSPRYRVRAAEQMERDGIRRLSPGEIGPGSRCAHHGAESFGFVSGCKNAARYHIAGEGVRCFTHAITFAGRAQVPDAELLKLAKGQRRFGRSGL